jgi:hypothetical protein
VRTCNTTGLPCVGSNYEISSCNSSIECPVDGVWTTWTNYSDCTASCGTGIQTRTRACVNQTNGGQTCVGSATQSVLCNTNIACPGLTVLLCYRKHMHILFLNMIVNGQWTTWSQQSPCSATCGNGYVRSMNWIEI